MGLFDLGQTKYVAGLKKSRYIEPRFEPEIQNHMLKYANAKALALEIGNVTKNRRIFCVLDGSFVFGDFIEALIVENNWQVKEMTVSTLSMSDENVDSLATLLDKGYVLSLNLIVSDFFFSHERHALIKDIYAKLDKDNRFQLAVASVHTKICLLETTGGNKIVIHGSANLRTSSNVEQVVIENSDELYDFNQEFHAAILGRYATINKSLRRTELWQAVLANPSAGGSRATTPESRAGKLKRTEEAGKQKPTSPQTTELLPSNDLPKSKAW